MQDVNELWVFNIKQVWVFLGNNLLIFNMSPVKVHSLEDSNL